MARNGDEEDAPETSSPVRRIRLGSKIGECARLGWGLVGPGWVTVPSLIHPEMNQITPSLAKDNVHRIRLINKRG